MNPAALRARCEARLSGLTIPDPFDLAEFCAQLSRGRDRPIVLLPMALSGGGLSGLWIRVETGDYVVYEESTTPLHQVHIALHEIGHLLCEHRSVAPLPADHLDRLFPTLDPDTVRRGLGRTGYSSDEESEAELLASLILQRTRVRALPPAPAQAVPPQVAEVLRRLESSL